MFDKSTNPVFGKKTFDKARLSGDITNEMTVQGTMNKTIISFALIILSAAYTWRMTVYATGNPMIWAGAGAIGGLIFALITVFKPAWSAFTVPVYAILEGLFLGAISALFNAMYPGIVVKAVSLTFGCFFIMLFAYKSGLIKVSEKLKMGIIVATGAIALVYLVDFILGFFSINMPMIHSNGWIGIGFSLLVVVIATLNLVLDFDFIEKGAEAGAPKFMEWYGAFGLMVTLIWLYIEFLRLLSKLNSRN